MKFNRSKKICCVVGEVITIDICRLGTISRQTQKIVVTFVLPLPSLKDGSFIVENKIRMPKNKVKEATRAIVLVIVEKKRIESSSLVYAKIE
jgi:hypothetical protein